MEKILLTGATGMLGAYVSRDLIGGRCEVVTVDRATFDLMDPASVYAYVDQVKPTAIVHMAAETDVDLCEREPRRAAIKNHLSTEMIARAASKCGAWLLYVSSSNVYGAEGKLTYNELDLPQPTNYYGRSKLFGEIAVRQNCPSNHLIVRGGWMIGGGPERDHKFVGKIIKQIKEGVSGLRAVSDRFGNITPANLLSDFILWALDQRPTGTVHFASTGTITRLDIARAIADFLSFDGPVDAVVSAQFPLSAPRPLSEGIESVYLEDYRGAPKPNFWRADLETYVKTFVI